MVPKHIYIVKSVYKLFYKIFKMLHCHSKLVSLHLILVLCVLHGKFDPESNV